MKKLLDMLRECVCVWGKQGQKDFGLTDTEI